MKPLFTLVALELFLGGGGRLLEIGPITLRMIFFGACLYVILLAFILNPRQDGTVRLAILMMAAYVAVYIFPYIVGELRGHSPENIGLDVRQSLYWLSAPFFAIALRSTENVLKTAALIRVSGVVLAACYIVVAAALAIGLVDYLPFYITLNATGEFAFRGGGFFFYKGFLFLGIAIIFFLSQSKRCSLHFFVLISIALAMTLTRGFVLSTYFAACAMLFLQRRWSRFLFVTFVALCVSAFVWIYMPGQDAFIDASREISNSQRIGDFAYIFNNIDTSIFFFGNGLGSFIDGRLNIENTFLWALWKLGLLGVIFWTAPFFICANYFVRIKRCAPQYRVACSYMFATLLLYIQTLTNPYLNNPIGLSFVLISMFSLRTLAKPKATIGSLPIKTSEVVA
jgi:hypothetical protein